LSGPVLFNIFIMKKSLFAGIFGLAALCAGGEKGVLFGGLRRKCAAETPARLYAEKAAGLLAFAA